MEHAFTFICLCLLCIVIAALEQDVNDSTYTYTRDSSYNNVDPQIQHPSGRYESIIRHVDNRKPTFKNCSLYNAHVRENEDIGVHVIRVQAEDPDDPNTIGGRIVYKLSQRPGERALFKINSTTGDIYTNQHLDRDYPVFQKELYIIVEADDDGVPSFADFCTLKVTVTDVNDNVPTFDQQDWKASIAEDMTVNAEVLRVFAYDFDEDENSRLTYSIGTSNSNFKDFFRINPDTGVIYLNKSLNGKQGMQYTSTVLVHDNGVPQNEASTEVSISVVGSGKKSPTIIYPPMNVIISIAEDRRDYDTPILTMEAESNLEDKSVQFFLVKGKTVQTNKDGTFLLYPNGETRADIRLARPLDYEQITEYSLTVKVKNKDFLEATSFITINVTDVNDEIPNFIESLNGSLAENDVVGARAMTVRATDRDGTSPNNEVKYELVDHIDLFEIDPILGTITTKKEFDREGEQNVYHVQVKAYDGAPSALYHDKDRPNEALQTFSIFIEDRNDNKPKFKQAYYEVYNISENSNGGKIVIEVKAEDLDSASMISYSIIEGNEEGAFRIEESTGRIEVVAKKLDYERTERYNLTIKAFDGIYSDTAKVIVGILNVNDEPPKFEEYNKTITIQEEFIPDYCIVRLKAFDPDIKDRNADQNIVYSVDPRCPYLSVDQEGCVRLNQKLDRDQPNGSTLYQGYIIATDDNNAPNAISNYAEVNIHLDDINDNAPILKFTEVVWRENQPPGEIVILEAIDYDSDVNGPPFTYQISSLDSSIHNKFAIMGDRLEALVEFDREQQKYYDVPINISDSGYPQQFGVSILRVIIGDENDNPARDGSSEIFVYKYEELDQTIDIGRVYVEDPDDWDLPDKIFKMEGHPDYFTVTAFGGTIQMTSDATEGSYLLRFTVEEESPKVEKHTVNANVTVTVKSIPKEAVVKSGSIRMQGITIEELIEKQNGVSKKDALQNRLARLLNTSVENVDIFTVLETPDNSSQVDVRFSAHGSPYYAAEKLDYKVASIQNELESQLGAKFVMISINECLLDKCGAKNSCMNHLEIDRHNPAIVYTNRTSFVGVNATALAICNPDPRPPPVECLNGGTRVGDLCECPPGFEGPNCEILGIGFSGDGWAMYQALDVSNDTWITLSVMSQNDDGLIFYAGPLTPAQALLNGHFLALEVREGYTVLKVNRGGKTEERIADKKKINDGAMHNVKIHITLTEFSLEIDNCGSACLEWAAFDLSNLQLLKVNGPVQVGGRVSTLSYERAKQLWSNPPTVHGFSGCIKNFTVNSYLYNLGAPADSYRAFINCNYGVMVAVSFGIDSNFLVAILVCVATLLILFLAVVVHKRKQDNLHEKDMDDTRENIINYEDEGGGESDTNFDLSVLRANGDEKPPLRDHIPADVPADIGTFLETKKGACDKDNAPYDDVRHYGYEGDGNSSGSLSSLASCTDEGDLKFNYLSSFGPRFRKLADIYGDDASEEGSQNGGEESWC